MVCAGTSHPFFIVFVRPAIIKLYSLQTEDRFQQVIDRCCWKELLFQSHSTKCNREKREIIRGYCRLQWCSAVLSLRSYMIWSWQARWRTGDDNLLHSLRVCRGSDRTNCLLPSPCLLSFDGQFQALLWTVSRTAVPHKSVSITQRLEVGTVEVYI